MQIASDSPRNCFIQSRQILHSFREHEGGFRGLQIAAVLAALTLVPSHARADDVPAPPATRSVQIVEHLGEKVPLDLEFQDERGQTVKLRDQFKDGKPILLSLVYFRCPMLCSLVLSGVTKVMREMDLKLGQDYHAVTVSFDWKDTPQTAKTKQDNYLQALNQPHAGDSWHFLTTPNKDTIAKLTQSVGFNYFYDEQTDQFAHAAVVFVLTPDGRISRYLYDFNFQPKQMKLALVEASAGSVGATLDKVLLQCYRYDPASRKYNFYVFGFLRAGGLLTLILLVGLIAYLIKHYSKQKWAS